MLGGGLKFVVAKSKELQTKIADAGASSQQQQSVKPVVEPPPPSRAAGSGAAFLALQQQETRKALAAHTQLLNRSFYGGKCRCMGVEPGELTICVLYRKEQR